MRLWQCQGVGPGGAQHLVHLQPLLPGAGAHLWCHRVHGRHRHLVHGLRHGGAAPRAGGHPQQASVMPVRSFRLMTCMCPVAIKEIGKRIDQSFKSGGDRLGGWETWVAELCQEQPKARARLQSVHIGSGPVDKWRFCCKWRYCRLGESSPAKPLRRTRFQGSTSEFKQAPLLRDAGSSSWLGK